MSQTKERPIIFSGESVRAILDGRKTMTRRVVKPQPTLFGKDDRHPGEWWMPVGGIHRDRWDCPFGKPGDRLFVKESWQAFDPQPHYGSGTSTLDRIPMRLFAYPPRKGESILEYRADKPEQFHFSGSWRSSMLMPRWASRVTLEIVNVRVERLQDISEEDAKAEGVEYRDGAHWFGDWARKDAVPAYMDGWNVINKKHSWSSNPFVWVLEFRRINGGGND